MLVVAGAGSGKTRVLTRRVAHLLGAVGVQADEMLAITFTNKAAGEMRERRRGRCVGPRRARVWVITFHAACGRILRREAQRLGYRSNFTIYDQADQVRLVEALPGGARARPEALHAARHPRPDLEREEPARSARRSTRARRELLRPDRRRGLRASTRSAARVERDGLRRPAHAHRRGAGALPRGAHALAEGASATCWSTSTRTRTTRSTDCSSCSPGEHRNVMVVGDPDQSMYGFRGADIHNILEFERDFPGTNLIALEQNYRSTNTILDAANAVIANNRERKEKQPLVRARRGRPGARDRGRGRARRGAVHRRRDRGAHRGGLLGGEIAVFYRTNAQSRVLEDVLVRQGIAYQVIGGPRFYERAEIKDAVAYLQVIDNPDDAVRSRASPIGLAAASATRRSRACRRGPTAGGVARRRSATPRRPASARRRPRRRGLHDAARVAACRPRRSSRSTSSSRGARAHRLPRDARGGADDRGARPRREPRGARRRRPRARGRRAEEPTLSGFLQEISLYSDQDALATRATAVTLMTIHNAKGLEFRAVFLIGMEEGIFPHVRSIEEQGIEEERRLCYVGMTRAKERLTLTHASHARCTGARDYNLPSRFLDELPARGRRARAAAAGVVVELRRARAYASRAAGGRARRSRPATRCATPRSARASSSHRTGRHRRRPLRRRRHRAATDARVRAAREAVGGLGEQCSSQGCDGLGEARTQGAFVAELRTRLRRRRSRPKQRSEESRRPARPWHQAARALLLDSVAVVFEVRPCADQDEYGRAIGAIGQYFNPPPDEGFFERWVRTLPHERMHAAFEDGQIVGGAGAFPFELSVPGHTALRGRDWRGRPADASPPRRPPLADGHAAAATSTSAASRLRRSGPPRRRSTAASATASPPGRDR